jgi:nucleotide-binding universal stress UspA family protein
MYQRILVAVDGSDTSNAALQEAIMLAKDQHAALRLIHVVDLTMAYLAVEAAYVFQCRNAIETEGKKVIADCSASARAAGIEPDSKCVVTLAEHIYDVIENEATTWGADVVAHGRRGIRRLLLGSVAEGLIRISSKPVLLIRGA